MDLLSIARTKRPTKKFLVCWNTWSSLCASLVVPPHSCCSHGNKIAVDIRASDNSFAYPWVTWVGWWAVMRSTAWGPSITDTSMRDCSWAHAQSKQLPCSERMMETTTTSSLSNPFLHIRHMSTPGGTEPQPPWSLTVLSTGTAPILVCLQEQVDSSELLHVWSSFWLVHLN